MNHRYNAVTLLKNSGNCDYDFYLLDKTMVARVFEKLLCIVGILSTDKITKVQVTDLVGEFVGQTGPNKEKGLKITPLFVFYG